MYLKLYVINKHRPNLGSPNANVYNSQIPSALTFRTTVAEVEGV